MLQLWSTLLGGFLAVVGGMATSIYLQHKAPETERRVRSRQAADELLSILTELRRIGLDPAVAARARNLAGDPTSDEWREASREWRERRNGLLLRMEVQALLIADPYVRRRLSFIAEALHSSDALNAFGEIPEQSARIEFCTDGMNCIGVYLRAERKYPPEIPMAERARSAMDTAAEITQEIEEEERARHFEQNQDEE